MRAAWYASFGAAADVLETGEMETPSPETGEVLVRVSTSGVNPVDVKRRQGGRGEMEAPRVIPHFDGAGVIEAAGDGVDPSRVGERVWLYEAQWASPLGSAAEYCCVPSSRAVALPDETGFDAGASLGIPALTAHRSVFADGSVEGKSILVTGGAGAVGRYAIQFAKRGGARVLTTVSSDSKAEIAGAAGADTIIDYKQDDVAGRVMEATEGEGVDRIVEVELGTNLDTSLKIIKTNGVISTYASQADPEPTLPFYAFLYKSVTLHHVIVFLMPEEAKGQAVADITAWMSEGKISHQIGERFSLDEIAAAHEAVEGGAVGKVLIEIG